MLDSTPRPVARPLTLEAARSAVVTARLNLEAARRLCKTLADAPRDVRDEALRARLDALRELATAIAKRNALRDGVQAVAS